MRRLITGCIVSVFLFGTGLSGQTLSRQLMPACTEAYFRHVIGTLAHDSMEGRLPGTKGEKDAAAFITTEMKRAGCQPLRRKKFGHPFVYKNPDSLVTPSAGNIVGRIDTRSKKTIVVGAHYDHLGWGKHHSNAHFSKGIHNGADDNASGVAMMLALAGWCNRNRDQLQYDFVFVAWAAEEDGLYGSEYFIKKKMIDTASMACYINFDMVGNLNTSNPILKTEGLLEYPAFNQYLNPNTDSTLNVRKADPIFKSGSDNYNFELYHIPSIAFSTGLSEYYHKPEDDMERINFPGMVKIGSYLEYFLGKMQAEKDLETILKGK